MNLEPSDLHYRTSDRLPHSGWAAFGPYVDKRAVIANRVVFWVCLSAAIVAAII